MQVNRIHFRMRNSFRKQCRLLPWVMVLVLGWFVPSYALGQKGLGDVGRADFVTPDWAKGLVWYQVFPERFRNGNPGNDPAGIDLVLRGWGDEWSGSSIEEIELAWNRGRIAPDLFARSQGSAHAAARSTIYTRRYGGDLQGVYDRLGDIRAMGFTGIYLCPVFRSRSLHKYDASDHRHIDPTLGHPAAFEDPGIGRTLIEAGEDPFDEETWAWSEADCWFVDVFLPEAKAHGLRVMLDGVWNHTGLDHFAFQDVRRNGIDSAYADWFDVVFDEGGELLGWRGWSRINGGLPEFRHVGDDLAPGPKSHIMAVTRRWMDPNGDGDPSDGIDGWRLDVAGEIGADFWRDWRAQVKSLNPDALIVAEIWHDAGKMLHGEGFDSQMNYPFAYVISDWLALGEEGVLDNAQVAANRLRGVFDHGEEIDLVQLNLMASHDTERLASMMQNQASRNYDNGSSRWAPGYESEAVGEQARSRALASIATMVASPGAVMVYNGDELALPGADDPDNRRPIAWGRFGAEQLAFQDNVGRLLSWRGEETVGRALRLGRFAFDAVGQHTLRVRRELGGDRKSVV